MQDILCRQNTNTNSFSLTDRKKTLSEIRIVLLGGEGVGKSTSGNIILQGNVFDITPQKVLFLSLIPNYFVMQIIIVTFLYILSRYLIPSQEQSNV